MRAYSIDLRQRVLAAVDAGMPRVQVAQTFHISLPTVQRYLRQRRQRGQLTPKVSPGRPRHISPEQHERLPQQLTQHNDATLAQHCQWWVQAAEPAPAMTPPASVASVKSVSPSTMWRAIGRVGWTRKKSLSKAASVTQSNEPCGAD